MLIDLSREAAGPTRLRMLAKAGKAIRESLRVHTCEDAPCEYAATVRNRGDTCAVRARMRQGEGRERWRMRARAAYEEALRIYEMAEFLQEAQRTRARLRELGAKETRAAFAEAAD